MTLTRPRTAEIAIYLKAMYATMALSSALTLHLFGATRPVRAESIESATRWMNAREAKEQQIDKHLEATDKRVDDHDVQISRMTGFGIGISGTLGVLQVLGMIADRKAQG